MPLGSGGAQVPVEALLRIALDKTGSQGIQDFLDKHESQWSRIERTINRVGSGMEGMVRRGLGLAGIAGVGAVVANFMQTSQGGSNVALASGLATGGAGVWHPYGQGLLSAQRQTGVGAGEIAQGLVMALQGAGGTPSPQQAAVLGALLAGYGQISGLTPGQVAQVVTPILQASNKPFTAQNSIGIMAAVTGALTNFPGSQAAPMLGLVSQMVTQQALGGGALNPSGLAGLVNTAAGSNSLFRNPSLAGSATSGVTGGLQNAYGNPSMEAFLQMAGIGYWDQRQGITPQNVQKIMATATRMYPDPRVRDMVLRSMFGGIPGADLLETFAPGSRAYGQLSHLPHGGNAQHLLDQIHHAQARTTPSATAQRFGAGVLHWLEDSPLHALLGAAGFAFGPGLLRKGFGLLGRGAAAGARGLFADGAASGLGADLLGSALLGVPLGVAGVMASSMVFPDSTSTGAHGTVGQVEVTAVQNALKLARMKFGSHLTPAARDWMQAQIYAGGAGIYGSITDNADFPRKIGQYRQGAGKLLDQLLGDQYAATPGSPVNTFSQAAQKLLEAAKELSNTAKRTSYQPGSTSGQYVGLGTPAIQGLGASAPGLEFASLTVAGASGTISAMYGGTGGSVPVSYSGASGAGWQSCTLTWYDPALGGTNSASGRPDPNSPTSSGQPYSATAMTCAAPPNYPFGTQIAFSYAGKTVTCTVNDRGGAIQGSHFDLARAPASQLGIIQAGLVNAQFRVVGHASPSASTARSGASSGSGSGAGAGGRMFASVRQSAAGHAAAVGGGPGGGGHVTHVHVHIDGREIRRHRVLLGHHHP